MDSHSTSEEPPQENSIHLHNVLGGFIAVLTLAMPFYITAHYSSSAAWVNTPSVQSASTPAAR